MESYNNAKTSSIITPLGTDIDGGLFRESWDYAIVIVMSMYTSKNSRPGIVYAVN